MKKFQKLVLVVLAAAAVLPACKKGEEDPFLSLRSRKSRVAGEWTVESREEKVTTSKVSPSVNSTSTETTTINGSTYTYNYTSGSNTTTINGTVGTYKVTFEKDGAWKSTYEYTTVFTFGTSPFTTVETTLTKIESSGIWNFLGKVGDAKNKENLSVSTTSENTVKTITSVTTTPSTVDTDVSTSTTSKSYAPNESVQIWKLIQLKNKEMKGEIEIDNSEINNATSTTEKRSGSISITLKQ
ncbi:MAG: hypothetical protein IPN99_06110 [Bacteroidetes bacterium]|nr:hypothetical protein [Bacteroidota bacterium]